MTKLATTRRRTQQSTPLFSTDDARWQALSTRDPAADGAFVYSVRTTGIYCRPTCPSRLALRNNVRFHTTCQEAQSAGFRPCKRCRPNETSLAAQNAAAIARACRLIEQSDAAPSLADLAKSAGLSPHHFHRLFKAHTGLTPKAYASAHRANKLRSALADKKKTVTEAIYDAGFNSSSRFYDSAKHSLGMNPSRFRAGGLDATIRFAIGQCSLGAILVAATDRGVCAILLGDDPDELAKGLQDRFPRAELIGGDPAFEQLVARVVGFVENPKIGLDLPLDIRGTAFQQRVWQALCKIPAGRLATYQQIAKQIGRPRSVRAVGQAIAANPIAVAIPCHRVIRTSGDISGYRWGVERKRQLQSRERA